MMRTFMIAGTACLVAVITANTALASSMGYFIRQGERFTVEDQKSIWSADRRTVTVFLLACKFDPLMLENWTMRDGHLPCNTPEINDYGNRIGAKLTFELSQAGELKKLTLETTGIGEGAPFGNSQVRHHWKSEFPVHDLRVTAENELLFKGAFDLANDDLIGAIR